MLWILHSPDATEESEGGTELMKMREWSALQAGAGGRR